MSMFSDSPPPEYSSPQSHNYSSQPPPEYTATCPPAYSDQPPPAYTRINEQPPIYSDITSAATSGGDVRHDNGNPAMGQRINMNISIISFREGGSVRETMNVEEVNDEQLYPARRAFRNERSSGGDVRHGSWIPRNPGISIISSQEIDSVRATRNNLNAGHSQVNRQQLSLAARDFRNAPDNIMPVSWQNSATYHDMNTHSNSRNEENNYLNAGPSPVHNEELDQVSGDFRHEPTHIQPVTGRNSIPHYCMNIESNSRSEAKHCTKDRATGYFGICLGIGLPFIVIVIVILSDVL